MQRLYSNEIHLDAIRGVAALLVMLGHARGLFFLSVTGPAAPGHDGGPEAELMTLGHGAVMIFFVLSGYLVGGSVLNTIRTNSWEWRTYLAKRLVRLWIVLVPAVFIGIAIDILGAHYFGGPGSLYAAPPGQDYVRPDFLARGVDPIVIAGNIFFVQELLVPTIGSNAPLWSLACEFWYYILFPVLVIASARQTPLLKRLVLIALALGIVALLGAHATFLFLPWLLGVAVSRLPQMLPADMSRLVALALAVIMLPIIVAMKKFAVPLPLAELTVAIVTAALIHCIRSHAKVEKVSLYARLSGFFSKISYTLYANHLPLLVLLANALNNPWGVWSMDVRSLALFAFVIALAVVYAALLYTVFEARTDRLRSFVFRRLRAG